MKTNAKQRFDDTIKRCESLIDLSRDHYIAQLPNADLKGELLRYAAVLAVSALDMYAGDRFGEKFVSVLKSHVPCKRDTDFLDKIHVNMIDLLELLRETPKRPYRRMRTLVDEYLSRNAMQSLNKIDDLYKYFDLPKITDRASVVAKRTKLKASVLKLVRRRNAIVHGCDYNGQNVVQRIGEKEVKRWIADVKCLVEGMDKLITEKFSRR